MNRPAAIVTGGNRGVGEGICNALASKGYNIFMAHCGEGDKAIRVAQRLQDNYGVRVETFDCDQRDHNIGESLMAHALDAFPSISLVMCNAGVGLEKYMRLIHPEEIDFVYEVNFSGSLLIANAAAKYMMKSGIKGTILFTSSIRSKTPTPMDAIYGGLKAGLNRAAQSMAREYGRYGIRVSTISPGCMCVYPEGYEDRDYTEEISRIPLRIGGDGNDIGYTAAFLASDEAKFITGVNIFVDGGVNCGEDYWSEADEYTASHGRGTFVIREQTCE